VDTCTLSLFALTPHPYPLATGILDRGNALIERLDMLPCWVAEKEPGSEGGADLSNRLQELWAFLRLRLGRHVSVTSGVGQHCLQCRLGSCADARLNNVCEHPRKDGALVTPPPEDNAVDPKCGAEGCDVSGAATRGKGVKPSWRSCAYCPTSFCRKHLKEHLTTNEAELGPELRQTVQEGGARTFVCVDCQSKVDECSHSRAGCASCEETSNFQLDLRKNVAKPLVSFRRLSRPTWKPAWKLCVHLSNNSKGIC
jgi:hypothetical protein